MAMCLRCMQEGKFVDVEECAHNVTFSTTESEDED
jgi:hypothetical protein